MQMSNVKKLLSSLKPIIQKSIKGIFFFSPLLGPCDYAPGRRIQESCTASAGVSCSVFVAMSANANSSASLSACHSLPPPTEPPPRPLPLPLPHPPFHPTFVVGVGAFCSCSCSSPLAGFKWALLRVIFVTCWNF